VPPEFTADPLGDAEAMVSEDESVKVVPIYEITYPPCPLVTQSMYAFPYDVADELIGLVVEPAEISATADPVILPQFEVLLVPTQNTSDSCTVPVSEIVWPVATAIAPKSTLFVNGDDTLQVVSEQLVTRT
jgi:hypothetical protein